MGASPIEAAFAEALDSIIDTVVEETGSSVEVTRQARIGRAVVDFLLERGSSPSTTVRLAVECDGHDFHERTKEQASRDKARDRALLAAGVYVFRFTGSDIHWDAASCADECVSFLVAKLEEVEGREVGAWDSGWRARDEQGPRKRPCEADL